MPLDEQDVVEIQQRIPQRDLTAKATGAGKQSITSVGKIHVDPGAGGLQFLQLLFQPGQLRAVAGRPLQVIEQSRRPPQHNICRVAVRFVDERCRTECLRCLVRKTLSII